MGLYFRNCPKSREHCLALTFLHVLLYCTVVLYCCTVLLYCTVVLYCCTVLLYCTVVLYCCTVLLYCTVVLYCCTVLPCNASLLPCYIDPPLCIHLKDITNCLSCCCFCCSRNLPVPSILVTVFLLGSSTGDPKGLLQNVCRS